MIRYVYTHTHTTTMRMTMGWRGFEKRLCQGWFFSQRRNIDYRRGDKEKEDKKDNQTKNNNNHHCDCHVVKEGKKTPCVPIHMGVGIASSSGANMSVRDKKKDNR